MECDEVRDLLTAYVDDELGVREAVQIERHLHECAGCREESARLRTLRTAVREHVTYFNAPTDLARRVKAALPASKSSRLRRTFGRWGWVNVGVALASLFAVAWAGSLYLALPSANERITHDVVSGHIRSLLSSRPVDVVSSNQHTVKPWFNDKLDYSPPVRDLSAEGFPLMGGRVDYLDHRPVAVLVYHIRLHVISVYVLPAPQSKSVARSVEFHKGFHVVHWQTGQMEFWAVSDVNMRDLDKFRRIFSKQ